MVEAKEMNSQTSPKMTRRVTLVALMLTALLIAPALTWYEGGLVDSEEGFLTELLNPFGVAAAADLETDSSLNPNDHVELVQGTEIRKHDAFDDNDEDDEDWCNGDFIMLNLSKRLSYLGICYGNADNPEPVSLVSMQMEYLGGATVSFAENGLQVPAVPIPIVRVFAQSLVHLIEFNDTGIEGENGTAGNGVFDFVRTGNDISNFNIGEAELVYQALNLATDWDVSTIEHWESRNRSGWNFTLSATNLQYTHNEWWHPVGPNYAESNKLLDRIAFTFHLGVTVDPVTDEPIPWWEVSVAKDGEGGWEMADDGVTETNEKTWSGARVGLDFKYDQLIEGWDFAFTPNANSTSKLMLESFLFRGTFVPNAVVEFMDQVAGEAGAGNETMAYNTEDELEVAHGTDDVRGVQLVTGKSLVWKDNFEKVTGELHWVANASVGSSEDDFRDSNVTFQVHAGQSVQGMSEKGDGVGSAFVVLGGYIYSAGEYLFHDPGYAVGIDLVSLGSMFLPEELVGNQFVAVLFLGVLGLVVIMVRKRRAKKIISSATAQTAHSQQVVCVPSPTPLAGQAPIASTEASIHTPQNPIPPWQPSQQTHDPAGYPPQSPQPGDYPSQPPNPTNYPQQYHNQDANQGW